MASVCECHPKVAAVRIARMTTPVSPPTFGIIIIGDEILSGKRQDKHLAKSLAALRKTQS